MIKRVYRLLDRYLLIAPVWNWNNCNRELSRFDNFLLIAPVWNWNEELTWNCPRYHRKLLIAPVWNWNPDFWNRRLCDRLPFNRTSLELKRKTCSAHSDKNGPFNRTSLELKHKITDEAVTEPKPFNRTSLELKPAWRGVWHPRGCFLLIAPVWNWNRSRHQHQLANPVPTFNRTSLELKPRPIRFFRFCQTFNRTSLELKRGNPFGDYGWCRLLIAPVWNWNRRRRWEGHKNTSDF